MHACLAIKSRFNPKGILAISRGSRSAPPGMVPTNRVDPNGVADFRLLQPRWGWVLKSIEQTGGVASLNHRLIAWNPFGMEQITEPEISKWKFSPHSLSPKRS